jgi:hypothetical protein
MSITCDAGNGCSITCAKGCYAMWYQGKCSKGCSRAEIEQQKVQLTAESPINLCVKELALGDVAALLGIEKDIPEPRRATVVAEVRELIRKQGSEG